MSTREDQIVAEAIEKWSKIGITRVPVSEEEYENAVRYIYESCDLPQPRGKYKVFKSNSEAWRTVVDLIAENDKERSQLLAQPIQPCLGGIPCADLMAAIEVEEKLTGKPVTDPQIVAFKAVEKIGTFWPLDDVCIFVEVPNIHVNAEFRLHNESGPAVDYQGHDQLWFINGIQVDEQIIMRPETQTLEQLVNEQNADVQAIRIERFGWLRFLGLIDAEVLDERKNDAHGTLETLYSTRFGNKFVATCVTGKIPVMGVPTSCTTCELAQNWLNSGGGIVPNIVART